MPRILFAFLFILCSSLLYAQEHVLDAETQKLWDAHTVVPKTDDIKALRAFLQYGDDHWTQMNGRIHTPEMWQRFHIEKNKATFEAADRILALAKDEPRKEPPPPKTQMEYYLLGKLNNVQFAMRMHY